MDFLTQNRFAVANRTFSGKAIWKGGKKKKILFLLCSEWAGWSKGREHIQSSECIGTPDVQELLCAGTYAWLHWVQEEDKALQLQTDRFYMPCAGDKWMHNEKEVI